MSSLTAGKHAGSGAATNQPAVAEPTFAERARTMMYLGRIGSLTTLSRKQHGFPFGEYRSRGKHAIVTTATTIGDAQRVRFGRSPTDPRPRKSRTVISAATLHFSH